MGYNIVGISSSGEDAIKKCGKIKPDLVLMNIMLKGNLDGIETAQKIRNAYNIPFIFITGYFDNKSVKLVARKQPWGYITKPFDDKGIQNAIEMAFIKHYKK